MTHKQSTTKNMYKLMGGYTLSQSEKMQMKQFAEQFIGTDGITWYEFDGKHLNFYDKDLDILSKLSVYELFKYDVIQRI